MNLCKNFLLLFGAVLAACSMIIIGAGCDASESKMLSTSAQLARFHDAGPIKTEVDVDELVQSKARLQEYKLVPGDMLEIQIPSVLVSSVVGSSMQSSDIQPHRLHHTRVNSKGKVIIPVIEELAVAGNTLPELEENLISKFYPAYAAKRPAIVARVVDYHTSKITITGAIQNPGVYMLRSDQMSLVSLIMEAGGIVESGAAVIRIHPPSGIRQVNAAAKHVAVTASETAADSGKIKFAFVPRNGGSEGLFKLTRNDEVIFAEMLNIAVAEQRLGFVSRVTEKFSDVPGPFVTKTLEELASMVAPGSVNLATREEPANQLAEKELVETAEPTQNRQRVQVVQEVASADTGEMVKTLNLPVKGLNVPFSDVALEDGSSVEVQALDPETFTVIGLVKKAGAFPYPANVRYNLLQALAFAGGVDPVTDPRYVRVYRQDSSGELVDATFKLKDTLPVSAAGVAIKPGDVVSVEHTPRTRRNMLMAEILGIRLGVGATYNMIDGKDLRNY